MGEIHTEIYHKSTRNIILFLRSTQDTNSNYISKELENIGVEVTECRIIQDKKLEIIKAINELRKKNDHVFTTGGIGPTHDDVTVESISEALGVEMEKNQEAFRILKKNYKIH